MAECIGMDGGDFVDWRQIHGCLSMKHPPLPQPEDGQCESNSRPLELRQTLLEVIDAPIARDEAP